MVRGFKALDQRTVAARALLDWRKDLLDDLGGEDTVSAQQMALVEAAVRTRLYVDHVDAWIMEHGSLVNARRRSVHPVVRERQQLVDSLARLLSTLGLERRQKPPIDLNTYLAQRGRASASASDSTLAQKETIAMPTTPAATPPPPPIPTAPPAREAAQALLDGLRALTLREVLDELTRATGPTAVEASPPAPPWAGLLGLSLDAFASTGAALGIRFPALGLSVWATGPETMARAIAAERRITVREVWTLARLREEARRAGLDVGSSTVEQLVEALGGTFVNWRPPA
jgi:hypothetical protein